MARGAGDVPLVLRVRVREGRGFPEAPGAQLIDLASGSPEGALDGAEAYYVSCEFNGELCETAAVARPRWGGERGELEWRLSKGELRRCLAGGGQAKLVCWLRRRPASWEQLGWLVLDMKSARANADRMATGEDGADFGRWYPLTGSGRQGAALAQLRVFHSLEEDSLAICEQEDTQPLGGKEDAPEAARGGVSDGFEIEEVAATEVDNLADAWCNASVEEYGDEPAMAGDDAAAAADVVTERAHEAARSSDSAAAHAPERVAEAEARAEMTDEAGTGAEDDADAEAAIVEAAETGAIMAAAATGPRLEPGPAASPPPRASRLPAPGFLAASVDVAIAEVSSTAAELASEVADDGVAEGADDSFHVESTPRLNMPPEAFLSILDSVMGAPSPALVASPAASPPVSAEAVGDEVKAGPAEVEAQPPAPPPAAVALEVDGSADSAVLTGALRESAAAALSAHATVTLGVVDSAGKGGEGLAESEGLVAPVVDALEPAVEAVPEVEAAPVAGTSLPPAPGPPISLLPPASEMASAALVPEASDATGQGTAAKTVTPGDDSELAFTFSVAVPTFRASKKLPMASAKVYTRIILPAGVVGKGRAPVRSAPPADCSRGAQVALPNSAASVVFDSSVVHVARSIVREQSMKVEVWHRDSLRADSMLGVASVNLQPLLTAASAEGSAAVLAKDKGRAVEVGKLHVVLALDAAPKASPSTAATKRTKTSRAASVAVTPGAAANPALSTAAPAQAVAAALPTAAAMAAADAVAASAHTFGVAPGAAAPPPPAPPAGIASADFGAAWELEIWKDAEKARFTAAMRERELARMDALEKAWREGAEAGEVDIAERRAAAAEVERQARKTLERARAHEREAAALAETAQLRHDAAEREMHARIAETTAAAKRAKAEAASAVDIERSRAKEAVRLRTAAEAQLEAERKRLVALESEFDEYRAKQRATPEVALRAEVASLKERLAETERRLDTTVKAKRRYKAHLRTVVLELGRTQQKVVAQEKVKLRDLSARADVERIAGYAGRHADGLEAERVELSDMRERLQSLRNAIEGTLADDSDSRAAAAAAMVAAKRGDTQMPTAADAIEAMFMPEPSPTPATASPPPSAPPSAVPPPSAPPCASAGADEECADAQLRESATDAEGVAGALDGRFEQAEVEATSVDIEAASHDEAEMAESAGGGQPAPASPRSPVQAAAAGSPSSSVPPTPPRSARSSVDAGASATTSSAAGAAAPALAPLRGKAAAREAIRLMRERSALLATGAYAADDPLIVELEGKIADLSGSAEAASPPGGKRQGAARGRSAAQRKERGPQLVAGA